MKKLCFILLGLFLVGIMFVGNSYATILWDYDWSSADDGSTFSGDDIKNIQDNVSDQASTNAGDNTFTGTNTFSGSTVFTGTTTGVGAAKDAITRGFELVWGSKEQVIVNVGTLYHGTTQINKTSNVHLDVTTASDYVTGVKQQTTTDWAYVYVDSSGNVKLDIAEPDTSDAAGDTEGNLIYYYYAAKSTYHRCIGAIYLNATGSGEIDKFFQRKDIVMWDVPVSVTTTKSKNAWSGAVSCAASMPSISEFGIFGCRVKANASGARAGIYIRPNGSAWNAGNESTDGGNGVWFNMAVNHDLGGEVIRATDGSQQIQHWSDTSDDITSMEIHLHGYLLEIR